MSNLAWRVIVAIVGIPAIVAIVVAGGWWMAGFLALLSAVGAGEFYRMAEVQNIRPIWAPGIATAALLPLLVAAGDSRSILALLALGVAGAFTVQLQRGIPGAFTAIATTVAGAVYPAALLVWLLLLRQWHTSPSDGAWLVIALLGGIWLCDSSAYFVGRGMGKHPLAPRLSPKKTWEGAIAGLAAAIAWSAIVIPTMLSWGTVWLGVLIGIIIGVVGQGGDVAKSLLKRDVGIKDSSAIIPGHGGVLDRFDSAMAAAPAVYLLLIVLQRSGLIP